ncbi:Asp-tRNA(Asn)/Glu-tRNA(Gln) amidotransferase subunit GatB [Congregibacter litoralis]|uniref:Aspartyl/glutamyl-tRNA(Asn/Gln) amidotransferase subunit B n=1 Tax=Congregibacter litoralis KT71 TaxID=314285 RepID=A4A5A9_9GAMM|nr:Asp-tRNA(Asn)/Glu-tRNA(Gln) amidotransferase subunit GatB [Congregibacter litoralis]EAQ98980.1 aspartyl/glutamyl-tRNA(Asn/Gln) amidotransferase subunit B [Congregibacter litoralis KT71]
MSREMVIGLEVHLQLATRSKIFSGSPTTFGAEPNTQANAVDLAMPGMLPVLNKQAVRYAVMFGLAIDAEIGKRSAFDRKNYFYPDLPKGYQISQFAEPIVGTGRFSFKLPDGSESTVGITRAHLEEDAGKSLHEDFHGMTGIDLNRAGTPLLEIVTEPDFRSGEQAVAFLKALHSLVTYLGISDGNMAEGSMRCDVNLSLRPADSDTLGTRTEIKNVNSFRFVEKAIRCERIRQEDILDDGGSIVQETRLYDADRDETRSMRSKEVANDYRYFPEPDLLPVILDDEDIAEIKASLPELPRARWARFQDEYGLSEYDAGVLTDERDVADYFEATAKASGDPKLAANWIQGELLAALNAEDQSIQSCPVAAEHLGGLILRIKDQTISGKIAKEVFEAMWNGEGDADAIIDARGLKQVSDSGALAAMVDQVVADNPDQVAQYRAADPAKRKKLSGFFVGQIMKASKGQANPQMVNELLIPRLEADDS